MSPRKKKEIDVVVLKDYKLSEIKKICQKQKGCENCKFTIDFPSGVCLFSPIGLVPSNWDIQEEDNNG